MENWGASVWSWVSQSVPQPLLSADRDTRILSRGIGSPRREENCACTSAMELLWCGPVIGASCSSCRRRTACTPLIIRRQWESVCVRAHVMSAHTFTCEQFGACGYDEEWRWLRGSPYMFVRFMEWGGGDTRFHLAEVLGWPHITLGPLYAHTARSHQSLCKEPEGGREHNQVQKKKALNKRLQLKGFTQWWLADAS